MDKYNESLSIDRVLYAQDIRGSIAYARANVKTGILKQEEFKTIERGLNEVLQEWEEGKFVTAPGDEGKQAPVQSNRSIADKIGKIFILRMSVALARLLEHTLQESYIQAAAATTK